MLLKKGLTGSVLTIVASTFTVLYALDSAHAQSEGEASVTWNGLYAGLAAGVSYGQADVTGKAIMDGYFTPGDPEQVSPILSRNIEETNLNGGLLFGLNHQFDNWVLGLEADLSWSNFDDTSSVGDVAYDTEPTVDFSTETRVKSDFSGSLRARLGYALDSTLIYISGGPTLARFDVDFRYSDTFGGGNSLRVNNESVKLGWTAGLGLEHRIYENWSVKGDYLYSNFNNIFDKRSTLSTSFNNGNDSFSHDIDLETHNFRIAIVRHF